MSRGYIIGISGGYIYDEIFHDNDHVVTFRPGEQPAFNDKNPIDIKISENWKDDFDGRKDPDYLVMIEMYRPPDRTVFKFQILRSRLAKRPELVRSTFDGGAEHGR